MPYTQIAHRRIRQHMHTYFFLCAAFCIALLSACTPVVPTSSTDVTPVAAIVAPTVVPTEEVAAVAAEPAVTETTTLPARASVECESGYHEYTHELITAPACIPDIPQKIITLDPFYSLQMAVQLGLPIIATGGYSSGEERFPVALTPEETAGIGFVGAHDAPNLEEIALLAPDLIIGDAYFQADRYALLSEIAPTILINTADWKRWLTILGDVGDAPEEAAAALAEYEARVAALGAQLKGIEVSFVRIVPDGFQLYRAAPNAYAPIAIMTEVGITRPAFEVGTDEDSWERLDWEGVLNLTADTLLYVITGDEESSRQLEAEVTSNPLWQQLPAVQAGQAYRVSADQWMNFGGLRSAHAVLDDLERYLMGE